MIYQCHHSKEHVCHLFPFSPYHPFSLESRHSLSSNCPELEEERNRHQLGEFGAMLHLYRNPPGRDWIGFTSWRQLQKEALVFCDESVVLAGLHQSDIVGWHWIDHGNLTLSRQAEQCHPGITEFLWQHTPYCEAYVRGSSGLFASYWVMRWNHFLNWMAFAEPVMLSGLRQIDSDPFLLGNSRALGYALERLFIIWYLSNAYRVTIVHRAASGELQFS